ncbi:MAG: hypothetical protein ACE5EN_07685 [Nitrospinota bacterium]
MLVRSGIYLSHARGHDWLFKLTGRYYVDGDWWLDDTIAELEKKKMPIYCHMIGKSMKEMPWDKKGHPLYEENLHNDKILAGASTQAFIIKPEYLMESGALENEYLYRDIEWVNYEQAFWYAVKELDCLHWPQLPIKGFAGNRSSNVTIRALLDSVSNPAFGFVDKPRDVPSIDIGPLIALKSH